MEGVVGGEACFGRVVGLIDMISISTVVLYEDLIIISNDVILKCCLLWL